MLMANPATDGAPAAAPEPGSTAEQLLLAAVAEIEAFADLNEDLIADSCDRFVTGMVHVGVPYRPCEWFGQLTAARRKELSRAARRLEGLGLADRVTEPQRDRGPTYGRRPRASGSCSHWPASRPMSAG